MDESKWSHKEIGQYTKEVLSTKEEPFLTKIQSLLPAGLSITSNFGRIVMFTSGIARFAMEVECAEKQKDWDTNIPSKNRWPRGLSLSLRKFDLTRVFMPTTFFLKYSNTFNSGILLIDPDFFIKKLVPRQAQHSLPFETCSMFYSIPWEMLHEQAGVRVIFAENNDWSVVTSVLAGTAYTLAKMGHIITVR